MTKSNCPACAAIWAAQQLFEVIENFGREHDMEPDAMQAALTALLALWVSVNTEFRVNEGDISPPVDAVLLATVAAYAAAMRHAARTLPVSEGFKAESTALQGHRH